MKIFGFEIKRAFANAWFVLSVAIGTAIGVADCLLFVRQSGLGDDGALIQIWLGTDYQFAYNNMFYVLLPLLACLPYAMTCFSDIRTGYDRNICVRTSRLKYMSAKALVVFFSGAVAVALPLLIDLFIGAGIYPDKNPEKLTFLYAGIIDCHMFPRLFQLHPVCYCLVFILLDAVFGGLMGLVSMCAARWSGSRFATVMGPFALYVFTGVLLEGDGNGTWSALKMVNPLQEVVTYSYQMVIMYAVFFIVPLALIYIWHRRRDIL